MTFSQSDAVYALVQNQPLKTDELLEVLRAQGEITNLDTLMRTGRSSGYGLARDGRWYAAEQNDEVREAFSQNRLPFLMDQYGRNRA